MTPSRILPWLLVVLVILAFPGILNVQAAPASQADDDIPDRVATLEASVATLMASNAALSTRVALLETGVAASPILTSTATVTATVSPSPAKLVLPTPTIAPTNVSTRTPAAASEANLRAGPGTGFEIIGGVNLGDPLDLLTRTADASWFEVELVGDVTGWIAAFLVDNAPPASEIPVNTDIPTAPTPTPVPAEPNVEETSADAAPIGERIGVSFINPHYNCTRGDGADDFYRHFQVDLFLDNTSSEDIVAPWKPSRWMISDGVNERVSEEMLQWCNRADGCYEQPDIPSGGSSGWTWVLERVNLHEWVQSVEFDHAGQTYRHELENSALNRAEWNYRACPE